MFVTDDEQISVFGDEVSILISQSRKLIGTQWQRPEVDPQHTLRRFFVDVLAARSRCARERIIQQGRGNHKTRCDDNVSAGGVKQPICFRIGSHVIES